VAQTVDVTVEPQAWFDLVGPSSASLNLLPGATQTFEVPVVITKPGKVSLLVSAQGTAYVDAALVNSVVELPGAQVITTQSGALEGGASAPEVALASANLDFPSQMLPGSATATVTVTGSPLALWVTGLDGLQAVAPYGLEQIASVTDSAALIRGYMRNNGLESEELQTRIWNLIQTGVQGMSVFRSTAQIGYAWPPDQLASDPSISAMVMSVFADIASATDMVSDWKAAGSDGMLNQTQSEDGAWYSSTWNDALSCTMGPNPLASTCYIVWALGYSNLDTYSDVALAADYIESHLETDTSSDTRAMCLNALLWARPASSKIGGLLDEFVGSAMSQYGHTYWHTSAETWCGTQGAGADVELTALVVLAFAKANQHMDLAQSARNWLLASRDHTGAWDGNPHASALALRAVMSVQSGMFLLPPPSPAKGVLELKVNQQVVASTEFLGQLPDEVWTTEVRGLGDLPAGSLELAFQGTGTLDWQVTLSHAVSVDTLPASGPSLTLDVALDSTEVAVPGVVEVALTLGYSQSDLAGRIAVVELEVPAGFVALAADLRQAVREQKIRAFEVAGGLVRLYIQLPHTQQPTSVTLGLLATMSARSQGAGAHAYMLYNKATQAVVLPQVLVAQ